MRRRRELAAPAEREQIVERSGEIIIELKYCERCGGLWFREAGSNANLCGPCTNEEPALARRYAEREQQATAEREWIGLSSLIVKNMQGVATEGGSPA
jgi:Zn-finger nucleic acid-binding protein